VIYVIGIDLHWVVFMARYLQSKLRAFFILGTFRGFFNE